MNELKVSAKKRASNKRCDNTHYKTVTYKSKISDYEQIKAYADSKNISVSKLCKLCVAYCLEHKIDITGND